MTHDSAVLDLIKVSPFLVATIALALASRGIATGELKCGGVRTRARTVVRATNPIEFWIEVVAHLCLALFFILVGLVFVGHAPHWFKEFLFEAHRQRHG